MARNKVIYGGEVLIDLTSDSVTRADVQDGVTFHLPSGEVATGTCTYDSDTSDDTATVAEVLDGKTFHARGSALEGTMPNNGAVNGVISDADEPYTIPQGYHDGSGTVQISATELAKLKNHNNIKAGVEILGELGTYAGEAINAQSKNVDATKNPLTVLPDTGYDYLSQVVVTVPYSETPNSAGGTTVTILNA